MTVWLVSTYGGYCRRDPLPRLREGRVLWMFPINRTTRPRILLGTLELAMETAGSGPPPSISPRISIGTGQLQNWSFPGLDPVDSDSRIEQSGRCSGSAELRGYVQNIY